MEKAKPQTQAQTPPAFELHLNVPLGNGQYANMSLPIARAVQAWIQACLSDIDANSSSVALNDATDESK